MKLQIEKYQEQLKRWPSSGYHILAQYDDEKIIVYQAYRPEIGNFAYENQFFGGAFSFNRMTWIKPNFLWMMYRSGWAQKSGQEVILAVHLKMDAFINYLKQGVYSTFRDSGFANQTDWKEALNSSSSRLQWDPDHNPFGGKVDRRAIQVGIRADLVVQYAKEDIIEIEDITAFVLEEYEHVRANELSQLRTPIEYPLQLNDIDLNNHLKLSHVNSTL